MNRYYKVLTLVVLAACFFAAGVSFGGDKTSEKSDKYISDVLLPKVASTNIEVRITLLELLNSGDVATVQKRLEALVDNDLAQLTLYVNNPPLKLDTDVIEAIKIAKKYREKYPEHRINPNIEKSVKKTLDFVNGK